MRAIPLSARRYRIFALVRQSGMNESRQLVNQRMKRELRVELHYPVAGKQQKFVVPVSG